MFTAKHFRFLIFSLAFLAFGTMAQDAYPSKPIQLIVPFPAGGPLDVATRVVVDNMRNTLHQAIIVENKPGASGMIGTEHVVRSKADGYTLVFGSSANIETSQYLYKTIRYDAAKDLKPIAAFANSINLVYVNPAFPVNDMSQLVARIKSKPGDYSYASPGPGTTANLSMELIKSMFKLDVLHVPFKGSTAAISAVAGDQLAMGIDSVGAAAPLVRAGKIKPIAVISKKPVAILPKVPAFVPDGVDNDVPKAFLGLFAPAGTPDAIASKLASAVSAAIANPAVVSKLEALGFEADYLNAAQLTARIQHENPLWGAAVKVSKLAVN